MKKVECDRCARLVDVADTEDVTSTIQIPFPSRDCYLVCAECYRKLMDCILDFLEGE